MYWLYEFYPLHKIYLVFCKKTFLVQILPKSRVLEGISNLGIFIILDILQKVHRASFIAKDILALKIRNRIIKDLLFHC